MRFLVRVFIVTLLVAAAAGAHAANLTIGHGVVMHAYGANPEFFAFMRSMDAYKKALTADNATLLIEPDSSFFDYLRTIAPGPK